MQAQFETIFKELGAAAAVDGETPPAPAAAATSSSSGPKPPAGTGSSAPKSAEKIAADLSADATFQETIRRTMARMQESGDQATAAAAAEGSEDDFMAEMLKAMKDMPGGGAGEGSEEEFGKMLMGMMEQLTNKEILYEPMKELNDKYPGWLEKNGAGLGADDKAKYEEQCLLVREMVQKFEEPTYKDENVADREYIVERMQKVNPAPKKSTRGTMLTCGYRCSQVAHRRLTSWATCPRPRRSSTCLTNHVRPSDPRESSSD